LRERRKACTYTPIVAETMEPNIVKRSDRP
jgi:hypothetical protein